MLTTDALTVDPISLFPFPQSNKTQALASVRPCVTRARRVLLPSRPKSGSKPKLDHRQTHSTRPEPHSARVHRSLALTITASVTLVGDAHPRVRPSAPLARTHARHGGTRAPSRRNSSKHKWIFNRPSVVIKGKQQTPEGNSCSSR